MILVVMLIVVAVCCAFVFIYIGVSFIYGRIARLMIGRQAIKSNAIVLTFDDGPGSQLTPAIMDILNQNNAKATFFLLGRNIPGRESIVRQISERGHEIGSHGYDHLNYWKVSPFRALSDIKRGCEAIDVALGERQKKVPFRPPYGKLNIICLLYLLFHRVPIVYWSTDVGDARTSQPFDNDKIALEASRMGGIVSVAHDFDRRNDSVAQLVLESTKSALGMAREKKMRVLTVSQLLKGGR